MKSFKEYINEAKDDWSKLDYDGEYLFKYRKRFFIDTEHAIERRYQDERAAKVSDDEIVWFFKNIMDWLTERAKRYLTKKHHLVFFSRKLKQGVAVVTDQDFRNKQRSKYDVIVKTWLTNGDETVSPGTQKVKLEARKDSPYISQEFLDCLLNHSQTVLTEDKAKEKMEQYIVIEGIGDKIKLELFCIEGKVWDITNTVLVEID